MAPIPVTVYDPLQDLVGRAHIHPPGKPLRIRPYGLTENKIQRRYLALEKAAMALGKKLDIGSWLSINQLVNVPLESWVGTALADPRFGMAPLLKKAVAMEVEKLAAEMNSKRREQERKLEMERLDLQQRLQYGRNNESVSKVFNKR